MDATLIFQSVRWPGAEHLVVRADDEGIVADGVVVAFDTRPLRLAYRIRCDPDWTARELDIAEASSGIEVRFRSDGAGRWTDARGEHQPELDGCIDVDVAATPFTNTLPIRRLTWEVGQVRDLQMVYFQVPELTLRSAPQRYSCLARAEDGATFRYRSDGFETDLRVDRDGFVIDYPGLWRRVWPAPVTGSAVDG